MPHFTLNNIQLRIPEQHLGEALVQSLQSGRYEQQEADALNRHLKETDRFLDLGAGAGYLCALAARTVGGDNVLGIEAYADMVNVATRNLRRSTDGPGTVLHGAVVHDGYGDETVRFLARKVFWASAIDEHGPVQDNHVQVAAFKISEVLAAHLPNVVVMDIEGTEADLAGYVWPDYVRVVIMEIHIDRYSGQKLNAIFTGFFDSGFSYCPWGTRGQVVVFKRPDV